MGRLGVDASVGALVWVRRRNGSWWPGQILGPDELPLGKMQTPRTGTPVKLLGREDASVDWYNLEKSKRVKAFRCGEYDDWIVKAKVSASLLSKKAVKYARREDAILHALELESARLGKDYHGSSTGPDPQNGEQNLDFESPSSLYDSEKSEDLDEILSSSEDDELSQSVVSFEEIKDSEDDGSEGVKKHIRGLEDLRMGASASLKRKKRKKNRRRTLTRVLDCTTAMVSVPVVCEQLSSPKSNESKINSVVINTNNNSDSTGVSCENAISLNTYKHASDDAFLGSKSKEISEICSTPDNGSFVRLFDVPLVAEENESAGLSIKTQVAAGAQSSQSSHVETISLGNDEHNESGSTSSGIADVHNISQRIEKEGTSKWQSKGKRNSRTRKKTDIDHEGQTHVASTEWASSMDPNRISGPLIGDHQLKSRPISGLQVGWSWNAPHQKRESSCTRGATGHTVRVPRKSSSGLYNIDVDLKIDYRPQHVPYVSMKGRSKRQRKPVIGHPLSIEVLADGSCDDFLSEYYYYYSSSSEPDCYDPSVGPAFQGLDMDPLSRRNGLLSKKMRMLSSLTGSQQKNQETGKPVVGKKLQSDPSIGCVSLKVIFERVSAALNGSTNGI